MNPRKTTSARETACSLLGDPLACLDACVRMKEQQGSNAISRRRPSAGKCSRWIAREMVCRQWLSVIVQFEEPFVPAC